MKITRISPMSGKEHTLDLPVTDAQMSEWEHRGVPGQPLRLVQDIFPQLTPAQREFIKTGLTEEDWATLFPQTPLVYLIAEDLGKVYWLTETKTFMSCPLSDKDYGPQWQNQAPIDETTLDPELKRRIQRIKYGLQIISRNV